MNALTNIADGTTLENEILGCVVAFEPDDDSIRKIRALRTQLPRLVVVDNSVSASARERITALCLESDIQLVQNDGNIGQAAALNQACGHARAHGHPYVLFFDQDTEVLPRFWETFVRALQRVPAPIDAIVVGCEYTNARRRALSRRVTGISRQRTVITTGSLVSVRLWERVGGFRSDYFIDLVDDEFCLRVRREGGAVWRIDEPLIEHRIGNSTGPRWALNYSASRWYYLTRNHIWTLREYFMFDPRWSVYTLALKMRMLTGMLLHETDLGPKLRAVVRGIRDGLFAAPARLP